VTKRSCNRLHFAFLRKTGLSLLIMGLQVVHPVRALNSGDFALGGAALAGEALIDPTDYQALHWRLIGPFRGGRTLAVTGIRGDDRHFYFGAVDGGVWETRDAGRTWRAIFDRERVGSIGAIAIAPSQPSTIYVGTGEADMRSDIAQGEGVYRSTDGGAHWTHIGLADSRAIASIVVDPQNPDVVFVAALGHPYGPNAERGVFRTLDGGQHWKKVLFLNPDTGAEDLAFKPGDPHTLYAAMWQTRRPPWSVYPPSDGPGSGLYVSHDRGDHWTHIVGHGFPSRPGRIGLAVAPTEPNLLYALIAGGRDTGGLYRSQDGGVDWQHVSRDQRIFGRCWYFCSLTVDPTNADRLYVMNTIVLRSDDGGAHFAALEGDPTGDDFHQLWIDPSNTDRMILGSDQGAQVTLDGGKSWSSWYNQPTAQIYHVSIDNRFPFWVYGAQQDSGSFALPSRTSSGDGITMTEFREILPGGENGMLAADPENPDIVYGDSTGLTATVQKLNRTSGQVRTIDPTLAYPMHHDRTAWTLPLLFSPYDQKTLYFANQRLFDTADGGLHWQQISPDLTRRSPATPPNLDAVTAADTTSLDRRRGVIYSVAPSPFSTQVIWVGTDDGLVWRTSDGGAHWVNVTPKMLTPWSKVAGIELSHFRRGDAYLAIDRHRLDDEAPYIYRTRDDGKTWTRVDWGIPRHDFVNVVREDPVKPGLLYAGTEYGVFLSFDDGDHWQSLQQNLPVTSVRDIEVHEDDLVLATHGRGIWIMDDITPLRQMIHVRAGQVTLFKPAEAIRIRAADFAGTPMPKDEPMASNPPDGAIIDYVLPRTIKGPVTITILDARNEVVRRYSSAEQVPPIDPDTLEFAPVWLAPASIPATAAGMQRFVWNLRYAEPPEPGSKAIAKDGVWAPPGRYTVELTVGRRDYREPLFVNPDPRVKLPLAAFEREFELARKVERAKLEADAAIYEAGKLLDTLALRSRHPGVGRARILALMAKATSISGAKPHLEVLASPIQLPEPTNSLTMLSEDLAQLEHNVDGADAAPSSDALAAYGILSHQLEATLRQWRHLEEVDMPILDRGLKAAQDRPI
jgi:photosystem II stability/assembly factor-like uncharacterized protein